jgi:hypothetical protein
MSRIQQLLSRFWLLVIVPPIFLVLFCAWFTPFRVVIIGLAVFWLVALVRYFAFYQKSE